MDKLKALQTELTTARDNLTALQDELPQFHALVTENEQAAETLRRERGDLSKQAEAKGRVNVAREMLEQHQSDIRTAQAEVTRLEQKAAREERLEQMTAHAHKADESRTAVEKAVAGAVEDLQHACASIIREWGAFETARAAFKALGTEELGTGVWLGDPAHLSDRSIEARVRGVLDALLEQGAPLSGLLEQETTALRYRSDYRTARPLPAEGLSMLVWAAVLAHPDVPHTLKLQAPRPKQPVSVRYVDTLPADKYSV